LNNIAASTPGSMIPQARIAECDSPSVYCDGVCAISNPSWTDFSDSSAIKILQAGLPGGARVGGVHLNRNQAEGAITERYLARLRINKF
jgi:hypothetical protein